METKEHAKTKEDRDYRLNPYFHKPRAVRGLLYGSNREHPESEDARRGGFCFFNLLRGSC